jgi:hypothetical protein
VAENLAADRSQVDALVGSFQERDAELFFELANLAAEGRLADVAGFGRAPKVAMLGNCDEITEIL